MKKWFKKLEELTDVFNIFYTPMLFIGKHKIIYGLLSIIIMTYTVGLEIQDQEINLTRIIGAVVVGIVGPFFFAVNIGLVLAVFWGLLKIIVSIIILIPFYFFSRIINTIKYFFKK